MTERRVVGVDYSTFHVDAVALGYHSPTNGGTDLYGSWFRTALRHKGEKQPPMDAAFRAALKVRPSMWDWLRDGDCVFVEAPIISPRSSDTLMKLARVQGAIIGSLPSFVHIEEVHPGEWKKQFCGKGDATKEEIMCRALALGFAPDNPEMDAFDAFGIAWTQRELIIESMRSTVIAF